MTTQVWTTGSSDESQQAGAGLNSLGRRGWSAFALLSLAWTGSTGCTTAQSREAVVSGSPIPEAQVHPDVQTAATSSTQAGDATASPSEEIDYGKLHAARAGAELLGTPAAGTTLNLIDGTSSDLKKVLGNKPVYLKFWASWCGPCLEQMPHLNETYKKYGEQIAVYAVNLGLNDSIAAVKAVQTEKELALPIAIDADGSLAEKFHVTVTPMHVLIDRRGIIRYVGHHANSELEDALRLIATGEEEPKEVTRPLPPNTPERAVELRVKLRNGGTFSLKEHADQPVAVNFFATWTDWYLEETRPEMSQAAIKHARRLEELKKSNPEIYWVSVASPVWTQGQDLDEYVQRVNVRGPAGIDEDSRWFEHFRVRDLPTTVFFSKGGAEVARARSAEGLDAALTKLKAEQH